ncbi:Origin recognition complex subunit 1 [Astathelohania contejeani]|uniref:Origin recognition complex subunit 1 n=1 Tax=Astathelohania contejeani TaxID=164912 RepID=A0ABQ7HWT4_9MICR|nr:Origin recognition complex subunit 1 [Thelohania contejeani]
MKMLQFNKSDTKKIYLRDKEILDIKSFIKSNKYVLHIAGNPGTGKTHVITKTLPQAEYYNYLSDINIEKKIMDSIRSSKKKVIIIDEFDKLYLANRRKSVGILNMAKMCHKKVITLSNNVNFTDNLLIFRPYTADEMARIVKSKLKDELGIENLNDIQIELISKKYGNNGDLRRVFEHCMKDILPNNQSSIDFEFSKENDNNKEYETNNLHFQIIKGIIGNKKLKKEEIYSKYIKEGRKLGIPICDRNDFGCILDLLLKKEYSL